MFFNGLKDEIKLDFTPVFIGGPGRTGTSVLHATICSDFKSGNTNEYVGESSYLIKLVDIYLKELGNFSGMTDTFFDNSKEFYTLYHANLIKTFLRDTWDYLGRPKNLVLKAPALYHQFPLLSQLVPNSKFILTVRNPLDIAASMKVVMKKHHDGQQYGEAEINHLCENLNYTYGWIEHHKHLLKNNILYVKYEDFIVKKLDAEIEKFLGTKIVEEDIWKTTKYPKAVGWTTDKYREPRQDSSIGNYKEELNDAEIKLIQEKCQQLMANCGYLVTV